MNNHSMEQVELMTSSSVWLRTHGLKQDNLSLSKIIMQISFRHSEDYVQALRKSVSSQYGDGLFPQFSKDGADYNLTATPQRLQELCCRLEEKAQLYHRRMVWLNTGSRKIFGVIQENAVTLILDFGSGMRSQHQLGKEAVCRLIREQVKQITKFNLVCSGRSVKAWRKRAVSTTEDNLSSAEEWLLVLPPQQSTVVNTTNALLRAMEDTTTQSVYLIAAGDFKENVTDVLKDRLLGSLQPIHTVSFHSEEEGTVSALRRLSYLTAGRFHAFKSRRDSGDKPLLSAGSQSSSVGPVVPLKPADDPPGGGIREDVYLVWWEMQEALRAIDVLQDIQRQISTPEPRPDSMCPTECSPAEGTSSRVWLSEFGLKAQKMDVYGALTDCAFRHSDGVVDIKYKPADEAIQSNAGTRKKLVNAKYCEEFAHMKWRDGSLVHVYIPAEKLQWYEERMTTALQNIRRRIEWLRSGSRELFGTVLEDQLYLLIDTSESMRDQLPRLKDKIHQLIQEQLHHKTKINMVAFGSQVSCWRRSLTDVNAQSLESVSWWVKGLQAEGSSNTLGALGQAFADHDTQAVYLLTDGRPDQPIRSILEQVQLWTLIPVHTISFNYDDLEANCFLYDLARETNGRFHCYHPMVQGSPLSWLNESEDIQLLKCEIERGERDLQMARSLHADCIMLDIFHHGGNKGTNRGRPRQKCYSAPILQNGTKHLQDNLQGSAAIIGADQEPHLSKSKTHAGQTKASLRPLTSSVPVCDEDRSLPSDDSPSPTSQTWVLSETQELLQRNSEKQRHVLQQMRLASSNGNHTSQKRGVPKESLEVSSAQWLRTNSLAARRLTIVDAVAPTAILHSPKEVPLLEKHVYSRVFDEAFPLVHLSNGSKQHLSLINPLALNLEDYKAKLEKALNTYERRLNSVVWRALPQEERDKFGRKPVSFRDQREQLLEALELLGWPVAQEDIALLEEQIHTGLSFLQQASDLQGAARQRARNTHTDPKGNSGSSSTQIVSKPPKRPPDPLRGQRVIARSETDGCYYSGMVRKQVNGNRVMVDFTRGGCEVVPREFLLTVGGAQPCPPLTEGDFVLVVSRTADARERFVPGVVIATPCRLEKADRLFSVLKSSRETVHCERVKMMKISGSRYTQTCLDLRQRHLAAQPSKAEKTSQVERPSKRGPASEPETRSWRCQRPSWSSTSQGDQDSADTDDQAQEKGATPQARQSRLHSRKLSSVYSSSSDLRPDHGDPLGAAVSESPGDQDSFLLQTPDGELRKAQKEDGLAEEEDSKQEVKFKHIPPFSRQQGGTTADEEEEERKDKMEERAGEEEEEDIDEEIEELAFSTDTSSSGLSPR